VWVALDPGSKLLLALEVGERTLALDGDRNEARAALRVRWQFHPFPSGPQSDSRHSRFPKPPNDPGRSAFPSPVRDRSELSLPGAFLLHRVLKSWSTSPLNATVRLLG